MTAVRQVPHPPASAISSTDQLLPSGAAISTLAAEDVEVVNAISGWPPTTPIDGPNPGSLVTCVTVACVVVARSSEPVAYHTPLSAPQTAWYVSPSATIARPVTLSGLRFPTDSSNAGLKAIDTFGISAWIAIAPRVQYPC